MRGTQENFDSRLSVMKQENEALWREIASLRQKHMKQQQIVNKLIQFLVTLVQPSSRNMTGVKRQFQLMINDAPHSSGNNRRNSEGDNNGPVIHELTEELLEATDDPDLLTSTPNVNSPGGGNYRVDSVEERPASSASYNSNYDDVNAMDDEAIQLIEQQPFEQQNYQIQNNNSNTNPSPIPGAQYTSQEPQYFETENNVVQTRRSRRRKAATTEAGTSKVAKFANNQNGSPVTVSGTAPAPLLIKTENDIDQLLMMQSPNNSSNSPASVTPLTGDEYINGSFLSNEVPKDLFDDQSQQPSPVVGGFDLAGGSYNDKIDLNAGKAPPSSSVVSSASPVLGQDSSDSSLQLATVAKSKMTKPNELLRLNSMEDVNNHLDGVQENLDSLKDILMGEGYSLDPNTLLGILNPYMSLSSDMEPGAPPKELTYEPFNGDLTDMLNTDLNYQNKTSDDQNKSPQAVQSILNTPFHE
uniref:Vertebrate heat shock transcription factor C-terminal domain-containing protein n=1 Tax=Megaselia scalaris TaxID=36166 RepID=T1GH06_MEGSC